MKCILFILKKKYFSYTGIDVFGRGSYGGGGFEVNVALSAIFKDESNAWTSVGLFAPGWTFEEAKDWSDYQSRENKFWNSSENSISNFFNSNYSIDMPFVTTFNSGIFNLHFY